MSVIIIRTLIIFAAILVSMRLMGKRQLGELELSELVVAVLVSDFAVIPLQDLSVPVWNGVVPVAVLLVCEVVISKLALKSIKLRSFLSGTPSVIIENGVINQTEMRKNRISIDELDEALRKKQILNVADVRYALLETDGTLSTILYSGKQPLTAGRAASRDSRREDPLVKSSEAAIERGMARTGTEHPQSAFGQGRLSHDGVRRQMRILRAERRREELIGICPSGLRDSRRRILSLF